MRIRFEIEPNDLVREAQKRQIDLPHKKAEKLLREHSNFMIQRFNRLMETMLKDILEFNK